MLTESVALNTPHELPFWDATENDRPFFMQIVLPYQNKRWQDVQTVANNWVMKEPNNAEAWYYMGKAAENLNDLKTAKLHYQKVLTLQPNHPPSLQALAFIAQNEGKQDEADKMLVTLKEINPQLVEDLDPAKQDQQNPEQYRF